MTIHDNIGYWTPYTFEVQRVKLHNETVSIYSKQDIQKYVKSENDYL